MTDSHYGHLFHHRCSAPKELCRAYPHLHHWAIYSLFFLIRLVTIICTIPPPCQNNSYQFTIPLLSKSILFDTLNSIWNAYPKSAPKPWRLLLGYVISLRYVLIELFSLYEWTNLITYWHLVVHPLRDFLFRNAIRLPRLHLTSRILVTLRWNNKTYVL